MNSDQKIKEFEITINSSRGWYGGFDFTKDFSDNIYEADEFSFVFEILIKDGKSNNKVAYIKGTLFDEDKLLDMGMDIVEGADYISQEEYDSCYWLSKSEEYKRVSEDWSFSNPFSGYLGTLFVYESYRGRGIAKYLLNNLNKFLKYSLNIDLRCLCIYPQPQIPENWINIEDDKLKRIMINTILKCGFSSVENENYYVKKYEML